jgi:uroporphyrinogen III methyltransferase/synthase
VAEGLVEALADQPVRHALICRPLQARDALPDALRERGALVDILALYATLAEPLSDATREAVLAADYVTFTSSSTVRFFLEAVGGPDALPPGLRTVSIGPATSETLREHGVTPDVEAQRHDIDGLIDALVGDVT